jgi:hypothetical protein
MLDHFLLKRRGNLWVFVGLAVRWFFQEKRHASNDACGGCLTENKTKMIVFKAVYLLSLLLKRGLYV